MRPADLGQRPVLIEQVLEGDRVGDLAAAQQLADGGEDAAVHGVAEMLRLEEFGDPVIGRVVDQYGAEQGLFGFRVVGWGSEQLGVGLAQQRDPGRHACFHARTEYHRAGGRPGAEFDPQPV